MQSQQQQMGILCDPQTPSVAPLYLPDFQEMETLRQLAQSGQGLIENRNLTNQSYLQGGVPGSPHHRQMLPNVFNFGLPDQQFQSQLLQRLQNINSPPYRPQQYSSNVYQQLSGLYAQQNNQPQVSPSQQFNFRVSQASSYTGSPVLQHRQTESEESPQFIRPLSQAGTITTTEADGRTRVIVGADEDGKSTPRLDPPPKGNKKKEPTSPAKRQQNQLAAALSTLRVSPADDDKKPSSSLVQNGPFITRSTSEKVPNRSELMSQVQRTAWARHTTK